TLKNPLVGVLGESPLTFSGTASDAPSLPNYGLASVQVTINPNLPGVQPIVAQATLTPTGTNTYTWSYTYTPTVASAQTVTVNATDRAGNTGTIIGNFTVDNRPVVSLPGSASANEGSALTAAGSFTDPDGTNPVDSWSATVNYGDGTSTQALTLNADKTFNLS